MLSTLVWFGVIIAAVAAIVAGAELFADHLAAASSRLGVSSFALALLLAGAEPEELATVVTASARGVDGVAFGDVIGANAAIVTVAIGTGAFLTAMPFGRTIRRYAGGGLVASMIAGVFVWDGDVGRVEGAVLVAGYIVFVAVIWRLERRPPQLGDVNELGEEPDQGDDLGPGRSGRDIFLVVVGLAVLTVGSIVLVEAVKRLSGVESTQTRLGLVVVGFATAFELVVLAWSASRRGVTEAVVAGVVGSFAYNATMSLGAGAVIAPLSITDPTSIRAPYVAMVLLLVSAMLLSVRRAELSRREAGVLLAGYPVFVVIAWLA